MNCIVLLLLLCCCGNSNGICGGNSACNDTAGCRCKEDKKDDCRRKEERCRDDRDCDRDRCDIPGIVPPPWNDCGCDMRPEPRRQEFTNYGRGETCGCEEKE